MGIFRRMIERAYTREETQPEPARPQYVAPPPRYGDYGSSERALTLSTVYRAVQIHTTAAVQLGLDAHRGGSIVDPAPPLVRRPDVDTSREAFIEYTVACLWLDGNAFWRKIRALGTGVVTSIKPLNPHEVHVALDPKTGRPQYSYRGESIPERDMAHLQMLRVPGRARGLGPVQAARAEIEGAIDARDYGSSWFSEARMPSGLLKTDEQLTPDQIEQYKTVWNETADNGIRVLGSGLDFHPMLLKPADVQFLDSQQFSTTQIARLFGVPAGLMLAAVQGQSRTYSNVLEEWRGYLQFTAMKPLREIETALSDILPNGQVARFNIDAFLRLDTKARYEAHEIALRAKFKTVNEVRADEGLAPLPGGDEIAPAAAPQQQITPEPEQEPADVEA